MDGRGADCGIIPEPQMDNRTEWPDRMAGRMTGGMTGGMTEADRKTGSRVGGRSGDKTGGVSPRDKSGGRVEILEKNAGSDPATKPFRKEYVWKRR